MIAATLVVVVVGGSIYWFGFGIHAGAQSAQAATRTATASLQTMQKTVSGSGTLAPAVQDDVNFAASGTVTAVNVVAGSTVTAGQTLATLDTLTENAALTSAQAALATANANLSAAQSASDGSSAAVAKITADQAAVAVAQASVDSAQTAYNGTTLTSPIAGLVTAVNLAVGDVVTNGSSSASSSGSTGSGGSSGGSGASTSAGSTFGGAGGTSSTSSSSSTTTSTAEFTVVGTNAWQVTVSVGATDLKNIAVKQQVQLSTTENPSFFGTVASIGLLPTTTTGAATYPVVVDVTGTPTNLYDGVAVTAAIVYERRDNVLTVPSAAVTTTNGTSTVNKVVNGKSVKTTVTVGEVVGNLTEITKGLAEGDSVTVPTFNPGALGGAGGARTGQGGFPGGGGAGGAGGFPGGAGGGFGGAGGGGGGFGGGAGGRAGGGTNG